jgi:predicted PurR-regulated permease PerM
LDQSIKNLISKVNQNYINKTDKINYINTIINKLQTVENNQPKYKNVTQYLINKLKEEISKIGVDANPNGIDEILNIFN